MIWRLSALLIGLPLLAADPVRIGVLGLFEATTAEVNTQIIEAEDLADGLRFDDATVAIPGKIRRPFPGTLTVSAVAGKLRFVVEMSREEAAAAIVAAEAPDSWPREALRAQAIAARSYLAAGPRHDEFDFCDTTHCQHLTEATDLSRRVTAELEESS